MNPVAIGELRSNLSSYLDNIKKTNLPLVFGERHKKEFLIIAYPNLEEDSNIFEVQNIFENKAIEKDYYKGLKNNMSDWLDEIHDDLFE